MNRSVKPARRSGGDTAGPPKSNTLAPNGTQKDALPPHDLESEKALLCACLTEPEVILDAYAEIRERYGAFYDPRHRLIYKAIVDLWLSGVTPDAVAVYSRLGTYRDSYGRTGADIVGATYLAEMLNTPALPSNIAVYVKAVLSAYLARQLALAGQKIREIAIDVVQTQGPDEALNAALSEMYRVRDEYALASDYVPLRETVLQIQMEAQRVAEGQRIMGATTGYSDLDRIIGGLKPPDVFVIAARPSVGKTALALNIALNAVERNGDDYAVGIFSLEMSRKDIVTRMLCSMARVDTRFTRGGYLNAEDAVRLGNFAARLSEYNDRIIIDDRSGLSIGALAASAKIMALRNRIRLLIIDYLQLIGSTKSHATRNDEVAYVSHQIKALAKELNVPIILLSQLNRNAARNDMPSIADLRDSGTVEEDADIIGLLKRDDTADPIVQLQMIIAKNRNGPTDVVEFVFMRPFQRVELKA
jgi:replicative DNA helicase